MSEYTCFQGNFKFFTHSEGGPLYSLAFDKTCSCHIVIFNTIYLEFFRFFKLQNNNNNNNNAKQP